VLLRSPSTLHRSLAREEVPEDACDSRDNKRRKRRAFESDRFPALYSLGLLKVGSLFAEVALEGDHALANFANVLVAGSPLFADASVEIPLRTGEARLDRLFTPAASCVDSCGLRHRGSVACADVPLDRRGTPKPASEALKEGRHTFSSLKPTDLPHENTEADKLDGVAGDEKPSAVHVERHAKPRYGWCSQPRRRWRP